MAGFLGGVLWHFGSGEQLKKQKPRPFMKNGGVFLDNS